MTTLSEDGVVNAAPYSFFNAFGNDPPIVAIGAARRVRAASRIRATNILATGEFVVNLVSEANAEAMNVTCIDAPPEIDELMLAGLTPAAVAKRFVRRASRSRQCPSNARC